MIEWLISDDNMHLPIASLILAFIVLYIFNDQYLDKPKRSLKYLTRFIGLSLLTLVITNHSVRVEPVSNHRWKIIYQNNSDIDVILKYDKRSFLFVNDNSFESGERLRGDVDQLETNNTFLMTASKDGFEKSKTVYLSKENVISDSKITEDSKIVKIEYRKVDYYDRKLKNYHGRMSANDVADYEVRVTLEKDTTTRKELDKLLDQ